MALFRPTYTKNGEKRHSRKWWFEYYDDAGKRQLVNTKCTERRNAELFVRNLTLKTERERVGVSDPFEKHRARPLSEHVADFETGLVGRDVTKVHRDEVMRFLRAFVAASGATKLDDLDGTKASDFLIAGKEQGLSAKSVNKRRAALVQFGRWLVRERRIAFDPFVGLMPLNVDADRRHVRRALTTKELARLLDAARRRPLEDARRPREIRGSVAEPELSEENNARLRRLGEARALVYAVAAGTGLRRGELRRTRWLDVNLERGRVDVPARSAKSRRDQFVDLRADLVAALKAFKPAEVKPTDPVFPAKTFPTLRTFKLDLLAAGLATRDEDGIVVALDAEGKALDFHALRTTLGSQLAAAGVHPAVAKAVMRHATIEMTMKHYTKVETESVNGKSGMTKTLRLVV